MRIDPYSIGMCYASVCVEKDVKPEETAAYLNQHFTTGDGLTWALSKDTHFKGGQPNPCPCDVEKDRLHYLFSC